MTAEYLKRFLFSKPGFTVVVLAAAAALFFTAGSLFQKPDRYTVKKGNIVESVFGLGTINAGNVFHLRTGQPAVITRRFAEKGDSVREGQVLLHFDSFGPAKTPISGVVTAVNYDTGELVTPQTPVITVTDLEERYISVLLEERAAVKIRKHQPVRIRFEALGEKLFSGKVRSVYPVSSQFEVRIDSEEIPPELLPGMSADITIETGRREGVLLIPETSVKDGMVTVISESGKTNKKPVKTGSVSGGFAEVTEGDLREGDILLTGREI